MVLSFVAVIVNSGKAIRILDIWNAGKKEEVFTWALLLISTALFRIQVRNCFKKLYVDPTFKLFSYGSAI
jgi:hypothetical protein